MSLPTAINGLSYIQLYIYTFEIFELVMERYQSVKVYQIMEKLFDDEKSLRSKHNECANSSWLFEIRSIGSEFDWEHTPAGKAVERIIDEKKPVDLEEALKQLETIG